MTEELKYTASVVGFDKVEQGLSRQAEALNKTNVAAKNLTPSLFNLTEKLRGLQSSVFTEKDRNKIALYNAEIRATEKQMEKLSSSGASSFGILGKGANDAFSAIRKIAFVLPGIGIAGIFSLALGPIASFIGKLFEASDAVKRLADMQKFTSTLNAETSKNYGKDAASLLVLRAAIESTTVPMATRLQAIKNIKEQYPSYFAGLTTEQLLTGNVANAYDLATASILRKARANAASSELEKIEAQKQAVIIRNQLDIEKTNAEIAKLKNQVITRRGTDDLAGTQRINTIEAQRAAILGLQHLRAKADQTEIDDANKKQAILLKFAVEGAAEIIKIEKVKQEKFRKELRKFTPEKITIPFDENALGDAVEKAFDKIKNTNAATIQLPVIITPEINTDNLNDLEQMATVAKLKAAGVTKAIQDGINVNVSGLRFPELTALFKDTTEELKILTKLIKDTVADMFSSIGEALGKSLATGGDFIKNALGGILPIMGEFLIQLGKAAILTSKLFLAIKASKVNPFTGIIAGIAAIAAGFILKNIKLPGFAVGGTSAGGLAVVGERGRELVQLPRGSNVIPATQTAAIMNQQMIFIPDIRLQGQDIVIAFNRASATINRNG